jgi:hypothetical protein
MFAPEGSGVDMTEAPAVPEPSAWAQPAQPTSEPPAPPPPGRRRSRRAGFVIAVILAVALVLGLMGGAAAFLNISLSQTYSPERAVSDYFGAQKRGDADGMAANATFLRGDGSFTVYFDTNAVQQMTKTTENTKIRDVKIVSSRQLDASTQVVDVSMTWHGKPYSQSYMVVKDPSRVHLFLYYSWRIQVPFSTIAVSLPNQPGVAAIDGMPLPPGASTSGIQVIQGFHTVTMYATFLYESNSQVINAVDANASVTFPTALSPAATASAAAAIKTAFSPGYCDVAKNVQCFAHTYSAPSDPGWIYSWSVPGHGYVEYTVYQYDLVGDPTTQMKLVVTSDAGKLTASGPCQSKITINKSAVYNLKGDFTATLIWNGGAFTANVLDDCARDSAG